MGFGVEGWARGLGHWCLKPPHPEIVVVLVAVVVTYHFFL